MVLSPEPQQLLKVTLGIPQRITRASNRHLHLPLQGEIYAGSLVINQALGWNIYTSVILLLALTAVYTIAGGLKAVMFTDALQAVVIIVGAFILMGIGEAK